MKKRLIAVFPDGTNVYLYCFESGIKIIALNDEDCIKTYKHKIKNLQ